MPKLFTPLALTLALAFGGAAYADTTKAAGDVYREAIWDIHAAADADTGKTGETTAADVYREAIWDIHAASGDRALAGHMAKSQSAARLAGRNPHRVDSVE